MWLRYKTIQRKPSHRISGRYCVVPGNTVSTPPPWKVFSFETTPSEFPMSMTFHGVGIDIFWNHTFPPPWDVAYRHLLDCSCENACTACWQACDTCASFVEEHTLIQLQMYSCVKQHGQVISFCIFFPQKSLCCVKYIEHLFL